MFRIINKYFWKSSLGPISIFLYNFIFIVVLGFLYRTRGSIALPSLISLPIITIGINYMPSIIIDLKKTTFVQKYFMQNSNWKNLFYPIFFFLPVMLITYLFFFALLLIINYNQLNRIFGNINFGELFLSLIFTMVLSFLIGQFFYTVFKKLMLAQAITTIVGLLITLFSGIFIPITVLNRIAFFRYISYFNPYKFTNNLMINSWFSYKNPVNVNGGGIFDFNTNFTSTSLQLENKVLTPIFTTLFSKTDKILNLIMPFAYIFLILNLNWTQRNKIILQFDKRNGFWRRLMWF